jgi:hypothetical protein
MPKRLIVAIRAVAIASFMALGGTAFAGPPSSHYVNGRYGYGVDIPAGFRPVQEADNSDGGVSRSVDGQSQLSLWGANLLLDPLSTDVKARIDSATEEGWEMSYVKVTNRWASWSGARNGRIFYARAIILCHDDQAGFFQLEYPSEKVDEFDPIVKALVKSFDKADCAQ